MTIRFFRRFATLLAALCLLMPAGATAQDDAAFTAAVSALQEGGFRDKEAAIGALVGLGDPRALPVLEAMLDRRLYVIEATGLVVILAEDSPDDPLTVTDPLTGAALDPIPEDDAERIGVNNRLRRSLRGAIGLMRIADPDPDRRLAAAEELAGDGSDETADILRTALETETDDRVRAALVFGIAQIDLESDEAADRLRAVGFVGAVVSQESAAMLRRLLRTDDAGVPLEPDADVRAAAEDALASIEADLQMVEIGLNIYQGISLGSVLLLAAIGLAITFGVMGVINMAHGEMLMIGAYTTFVVQEIFRAYMPGLVDFYVLFAIPAAFLMAGAVGVAMERGVIRFLYGRPLETLLATWGISLVLQQAVRVIFGAPNREVANPDWMTGGFDAFGGAILTYNRLYIIVFAILVLIGVAAAIRYTHFGLQMRAVTQNRPMASAMGIRSGWVDALTFGLGSGIAGVGGVALSQIGNVSPNLGQSYIVDSFMVVVFGGVGSLWGVLTAAMSLGVINKFLEPYAGAVLGKILVLVFIILFIQRYPRGLFALKGRAAEG